VAIFTVRSENFIPMIICSSPKIYLNNRDRSIVYLSKSTLLGTMKHAVLEK
jgi:hypothetical protein